MESKKLVNSAHDRPNVPVGSSRRRKEQKIAGRRQDTFGILCHISALPQRLPYQDASVSQPVTPELRFAAFLSCRTTARPVLRLLGSRRISKSQVAGTAKGNIGFTLIELMVVIAIIALLALLVAPAVQRAIVSSNFSKATANMRSLAGAVQIYTADNQGTFPRMRGPGADWSWESLWPTTIAPYTTGKTNVPNSAYDKIYLNPLEKNHHRFTDFGCNSYIFAQDKPNNPPREAVKLASVPRPSQTIMLSMAQEKSGTTLKGTWYMESEIFVASGTNSQHAKPSDLGLGRISFINVDGSSSSLPWEEFVTRREELLDPQKAK